MTYDLATPPWKQKPPQTDRGWGELTSLQVLSPLPPFEKKVKHWLHSTPAPTPPIAAFVGPPLCKGWPRGSFPLLFLHFGLLLATPCPLPSFSLRPIIPCHLAHTRTFYVISRAPLPQGFWGSSMSGIFSPPSKGPFQALSTQNVGLTRLLHSP